MSATIDRELSSYLKRIPLQASLTANDVGLAFLFLEDEILSRHMTQAGIPTESFGELIDFSGCTLEELIAAVTILRSNAKHEHISRLMQQEYELTARMFEDFIAGRNHEEVILTQQ